MDIKGLYDKYIMNSYQRFDVEVAKGRNSDWYDDNGVKHIDFTSGIGVNSLGLCSDEWAEAVSTQAKLLPHTSNLYYTRPAVELAKKLCDKTGYSKVFFCNSGAEANEGAIKLARKRSYDKYGNGMGADFRRNTIITLENSFHGRTVTTLSATGQDAFHKYFFPFTPGFVFAKPNNIEDLKSKIDSTVCGIMLEFIQGEGGVVPLNAEFVAAVKTLCEEHDLTFIADEVQTGVGRTGKFLAGDWFGVTPNITTLAKGLGGGLPIGAVLADIEYGKVFSHGDHGTTFGANPVVCAGANVVMDTVLAGGFLNDVVEKGKFIVETVSKCVKVNAITGKGMMLGISLKDTDKTARQIAEECIKIGLLVLTAKEKVRLLPPLNITMEELKRGIEILINVIEKE